MLLAVLTSIALAAPGAHLPVGAALLAPRAGLGVEASNNPLRSDRTIDGRGASNLYVSVGANLDYQHPNLYWSVAGGYDLRKFVTTNDARLDRYNDAQVQASVDAFRSGVVGVQVEESLLNRNTPVDSESQTRPYTTLLTSRTRAAAVVRPGSALAIDLGAQFIVDDYQTASAPNVAENDYNTRYSWVPFTNVRWHFLPRTALIAEAEYNMASWALAEVLVQDEDTVGFAASTTTRVRGGLRGRITDRLLLDVTSGYGGGNFDEDTTAAGGDAVAVDVSGAQRFLLRASANYEYAPEQTLTLTYERDFRPAYFTNFVAYNKAIGTVRARVAPAVVLGGELGWSLENYRGQQTRDDIFVHARGLVMLRANDWAMLNLSPEWSHRYSTDDNVEYDELRTILRLDVTY
jgi:hypothetical protein